MPANTYIATWLAVTQTGARPVPVEPVESTYNIDPDQITATLISRTRAVIAVHLYGQTADMDAVNTLARERGIKVLENAAQAHGVKYRGRKAGALADQVRALRNYGSRRKYVNDLPGCNSRLDELQAAFLRVKLRHLDEWNVRRSRAAAWYLGSLPRLMPEAALPATPAWPEPCWHQFVVRVMDRSAGQARLAGLGIDTLIHYPIPPHLQQAYAGLNLPRGSFPLAERLADEVLSLPMGPHLDVAALSASFARPLE